MTGSLKIVYNPASRSGRSKKIAAEVQEYLTEIGHDFTFVETEAPRDGIKKAMEAKDEGIDIVVSLGGDGTAHEVANGVIKANLEMNGNLAFALIPAGTGNDFANAIGVKGNWQETLEMILTGREEKLSIVKVGDRYSINVADSGLGADVSRRSQYQLKWIKGSFKYTLLTFRSLMSHKPYPCTVILDGKEIETDINMLVAGFGQSFGGGMNILPNARFNKKEMDVAVIHSAKKLTILRIFPKVFSGTHINYTKYCTMLHGTELEIIPKNDDRPLWLEAEGEMVGTGQFKMTAIPRGFKVIIPKDWSLDNKTL